MLCGSSATSQLRCWSQLCHPGAAGRGGVVSIQNPLAGQHPGHRTLPPARAPPPAPAGLHLCSLVQSSLSLHAFDPLVYKEPLSIVVIHICTQKAEAGGLL